MFYHDHRVAQVAKFLEAFQKSLVVALVQADARLVEDIEYIDQLTANLSSQTDALTLTARERSRLAVEREIIQSHVEKEVDTGAQFLDDFVRHLCLHGRQMLFHLFEPRAEFGDVEACHLRDILVPDAEGERFLLESQTVAFRAVYGRDKLVGPFLSGGALIVFHHLLQVIHHAIVGAEIIRRSIYLLLGNLHVFQTAI